MVWLLQCTLHGVTPEDHLVAATGNSGVRVICLPWHICVKLLLHELHWLPVFFQGQFKMLNLSAIKLYIAHGQLFEGPPSSWSFCKSCQGESTLSPFNQTISSFEIQEECFVVAMLDFQNEMVSTLMILLKFLKTWWLSESLGTPLLEVLDICVDVSCLGCHFFSCVLLFGFVGTRWLSG